MCALIAWKSVHSCIYICMCVYVCVSVCHLCLYVCVRTVCVSVCMCVCVHVGFSFRRCVLNGLYTNLFIRSDYMRT